MKPKCLFAFALVTLAGSCCYPPGVAGAAQGSKFVPAIRSDMKNANKEATSPQETSPHTVSFVTVDTNVKLEVLDWGGSGRPLILLAGLGDTAHVFDHFALQLTPTYHVYGITRRGFGASSAPAPANGNYSADRLGDDVLAVIEALHLNRPVLVGHSIAGEELSSVGSRYPDKVAGLIYLEAAYAYAYYDRSQGDLLIDALALRKKLDQLVPGAGPDDQRDLVRDLLQTSLPQFEKDLREQQKALESMPARSEPLEKLPLEEQAILSGQQEFTDIRVSVLAIFAHPHSMQDRFPNDAAARSAAEAKDLLYTGTQAKALEAGLPSARVVLLPQADHYIFRSNEQDVLREINAFMASLR